MPQIVDYADVLAQLRAQHMRCVYHNSGAFTFEDDEPGAQLRTIGWTGPPDASIRAEMRALAQPVAPPFAATLARLARVAWQEHLGAGDLWAMPKSHWAFELGHGSGSAAMQELLESVGVTPSDLAARTDAAAVAFAAHETDDFARFLQRLLEILTVSDFALAFPGRPVLCTVHHHQQLWWQTTDVKLGNAIDALVPAIL